MKELIENIIPGAVEDPDNLDLSKVNLKGFDELSAFTAQLSEDKTREAKEMLQADIEEMKSGKQTEETKKAISNLEKALADMDRPPALPRFDCDEQLEKTRRDCEGVQKQMLIMKSMGISDEQIAQTAIDFDQIEKQLSEGLKKAQEGYRTGAHFLGESRSPHEGQEEKIAAQLLENYGKGAETAGGDYAFVNLSGKDLSGIDLSGAFLEYADLFGAVADSCLFVKARLGGAKFGNASLNEALFVEADLKLCYFGGARMRQAQLTKANCEGAFFPGAFMSYADLSHANLTGADMSYTELHRANLHKIEKEGVRWNKATRFAALGDEKARAKAEEFVP